jgi:hypothetical protein
MKNIIFFFLAFVTSLEFISCEKTTIKTNLPESDTDVPISNIKLFKACWSEWGREDRNCAGWGLCKYEDCWIWQDPCCEDAVGSGEVFYNKVNKTAVMRIKLNNTDPLQIKATQSNLPLPVDADIMKNLGDGKNWDSALIKAGIYPFNSNIGKYGGYEIPMILYPAKGS